MSGEGSRMFREWFVMAWSTLFMDEIDWMTMIKSGSGGDSKVRIQGV